MKTSIRLDPWGIPRSTDHRWPSLALGSAGSTRVQARPGGEKAQNQLAYLLDAALLR